MKTLKISLAKIGKQSKKIATMCLVAVGATALTVIAFGGEEWVSGVLLSRDIKLMWNNVEFQPTDPVNGERVYPLIYNGRTYIPARFIAEKAGVAVDWDADSRSVLFDAQFNALDGTPWKDAANYGGTPATPATPSTNTASFNGVYFKSPTIDLTFLHGQLDGLKLEEYTANNSFDSNGAVVHESYTESSTGIVSESWRTIDLESVVDDKDAIARAYANICNALEANGYKFVGISPEHDYPVYGKDGVEVRVWNLYDRLINICVASGIFI